MEKALSKDTCTNLINPDFSKRITSLRFILAVLVVFIHCKIKDTINYTDGSLPLKIPFYANLIQTIITNLFGGIAVPLFFIFSSYLFFAKPKSVKENIKSKFKTIVIPFIFWTVFTIFIYFIAQSFSFSRPYFSQSRNIIKNWQFMDYLKAFFAREDDDAWYPFVYQFWYLRNLLIFMIISPVIKFFASRFSLSYFCTVLSIAILGRTGLFFDPLSISSSLFYYSLGFYAVKHIQKVLDFLDSIRWRDFAFSYILFATLSLFLTYTENKTAGMVAFACQIFTILLFIKLAGLFSKNENTFKKLSYLSTFSFWIYATHAPFVTSTINKLLPRIIPMKGPFILLVFLSAGILTISILLPVGILLKKLLPGFFAFVTGGRKNRNF